MIFVGPFYAPRGTRGGVVKTCIAGFVRRLRANVGGSVVFAGTGEASDVKGLEWIGEVVCSL